MLTLKTALSAAAFALVIAFVAYCRSDDASPIFQEIALRDVVVFPPR